MKLGHGESDSFDVNGLSNLGYPTRNLREQSANRVGVDVEVHAQQIVEVVDGQPGADSVVLGTDLDHKRFLTVVFVADVSDDLLEQVLQGHEAGGAPILVCDDGDVRPGPHLDEQLLRRLGLGNEVRLPSKVRHGLVDTACPLSPSAGLSHRALP